ncbi:hypothetical protein, partial [Mesorhizobium sp. M7A.F.Ca.CA.004.04.1.1]
DKTPPQSCSHRFWYENGTGTMVFDFNPPISGYDLAGLQISFGRLGEGSHKISMRFAIRGRWRSVNQARIIGRNARGNMGLMLRWVSSIARWNT